MSLADVENFLEENERKELLKKLFAQVIMETKPNPFFKVMPFKLSNFILSFWHKIDNPELDKYVTKHLDKNSKNSLHLIRAFTPEILGGRNPIPYKSDFGKQQYKDLESVFRIRVIFNKVIEGFTENVNVKKYEYSNHKSSDELLLKQFTALYNEELDEDTSRQIIL